MILKRILPLICTLSALSLTLKANESQSKQVYLGPQVLNETVSIEEENTSLSFSTLSPPLFKQKNQLPLSQPSTRDSQCLNLVAPVVPQQKMMITANENAEDLEIPGLGINLEEIKQIGKVIWTIVEKGQPVIDLKKQEVAHALPEGIQCWNQLSKWQAPKSYLVKVNYTNAMNVKVIDFAYRIYFSYGGTFGGKGYYLSNVSVQPAELTILWGGFNFDVGVKVHSPLNVGIEGFPVAGLQVDVSWTASSVLWKSLQGHSFYLDGRGQFKQLL